jgi:AcrR family transcriptional regulator
MLAGMKRRATEASGYRRKPTQKRAQATVDAMLDAVIRLLKRGVTRVTTNQIAETAGVSIGSVYQYFPDKRALFTALHQRHIEQVDGEIARRIAESTESSLDSLVLSLVDGMVELHAADPELAELLQSEVAHSAEGAPAFPVRVHDALRAAIAPHARSFGRRIDLNTRAFVVANMLDALGHSIVLRRPRGLSLEQAKRESCRAILAYLGS